MQEDNPDQRIIGLWLDGRSPQTQRAYRAAADRLFAFLKKPLQAITLDDLQSFSAHLDALKLVQASRHQVFARVKSLFAFAALHGHLKFNLAQPLRKKAGRDTLSERILEESEVGAMIGGETDARNRLMLQLLYYSGVRVSELTGLTWGDVHPHRGAAVITVLGKGNKTRSIRLEGAIGTAMLKGRDEAAVALTQHVFVGRGGRGALSNSQVWRIVRAAAKRAGITKPVSTHWMRHCHASHALDNGADLELIRAELGHSNIATTSRYLHARPNKSSSKFLPEM